jgi:putative FmdB family regulatory protein
MPTYEYKCKACGHEMEEFQSITEEPLKHCPHCDTDNLVRVIGTGAGLIFRGTGFYLTDYKKSHVAHDDGEKKKSKPDDKGGKTASDSGTEKKP